MEVVKDVFIWLGTIAGLGFLGVSVFLTLRFLAEKYAWSILKQLLPALPALLVELEKLTPEGNSVDTFLDILNKWLETVIKKPVPKTLMGLIKDIITTFMAMPKDKQTEALKKIKVS